MRRAAQRAGDTDRVAGLMAPSMIASARLGRLHELVGDDGRARAQIRSSSGDSMTSKVELASRYRPRRP
jgi:hypothetical protein